MVPLPKAVSWLFHLHKYIHLFVTFSLFTFTLLMLSSINDCWAKKTFVKRWHRYNIYCIVYIQHPEPQNFQFSNFHAKSIVYKDWEWQTSWSNVHLLVGISSSVLHCSLPTAGPRPVLAAANKSRGQKVATQQLYTPFFLQIITMPCALDQKGEEYSIFSL
jgi:hypothetical protein